LLSFLSLEILRLEYSVKELDEQAHGTRNERESKRQQIADATADLEAIAKENGKIKLMWNDVLVSIQTRDKSFEKLKNDLL